MAAGVQNAWDTTANNNATADTNIGWAEGQAPSTVNNSSRAMMAAVAKWRKDMAGMLVTGGTSTADTLTTNETLTLADGVTVTCRMSATNGAAPTLNVDSTGAVAIQAVQGTAIPLGALVAGGIYEFTYYASSAAWIVRGAVGVVGKYIGEVFDFAGTTAPALSLLCYGQAVSRTTYAALFAVLSTTFGVGDGSTTFNVPDLRGRVVAGQDDMGGSSANRLTGITNGVNGDTFGLAGGLESTTIAQENLPNVSLSASSLTASTSTTISHNAAALAATVVAEETPSTLNVMAASNAASIGATSTTSIGGSVPLGGSGTAINNVQPTLILNKCIFAGA